MMEQSGHQKKDRTDVLVLEGAENPYQTGTRRPQPNNAQNSAKFKGGIAEICRNFPVFSAIIHRSGGDHSRRKGNRW